MRLFVAVKPPQYVIEFVERLKARLVSVDSGIRYVGPENMHMTLVFIGEVDRGALPGIEESIGKCTYLPPFEVMLGKAGVFPSLENPRVLWVGGYDENFARLSVDLRRALGVVDDNRPICHLTLARMKGVGKGKLSRLVELSNGFLKTKRISFTVDKVLLFESFLRKSGAEYSVIREFKLKGEENG